jgi:hypothetical protein
MKTLDICENNHGGNPESAAANERTQKDRDRKRVLWAIVNAGARGATCDELEHTLALKHQTCSARCSELLRDGLVSRASKSDGSHVKRRTATGSWAAVLFFAPAQLELFSSK